MKSQFIIEKISKTQKEILKLLFEKDYLQKELKKKINTSSSNLFYHVNKLENYGLINKETLNKIGNAKNILISLNPSSRQLVREILGYEVKNYTLITGFGVLKEGYKIPEKVFKLLKEKNYPISRIVCFTSPDALTKLNEKQKNTSSIKIDKFIKFPYEDFRNIDSEFFMKVETILSEEMRNANLIIDLTPLSKLYSFKLLELANKYQLPCIYMGINKEQKEELFSMVNMEIKGKIKNFK
ncbi:MAG: hypothetical protein ACP6IY_20240 [Promethearchaeia archaeon]